MKNTNLFLKCYKIFSFFKYQFFVHLFVTDSPTLKNRFQLNYYVESFKNSSYMNFINQINELKPVKTVNFLFYGAGWSEREAWDMFGIFFLHHPNLQRLIADYGFRGYPLRKDFPLSGYKEIWFSPSKARIRS